MLFEHEPNHPLSKNKNEKENQYRPGEVFMKGLRQKKGLRFAPLQKGLKYNRRPDFSSLFRNQEHTFGNSWGTVATTNH